MNQQLVRQIKSLINQASRLKHERDFIDPPVPLPGLGSWEDSLHCVDKLRLLAISAAASTGRPLFLQGDPGTGKSNLARAAAVLLERHFMSYVIQPFTEYQDLMWTVDHTARLGHAQILGAMGDLSEEAMGQAKSELNLENYLSPGPLWWAMDWIDAEKRKCKHDYKPEVEGEYKAAENGVVMLIDEIDKADASLANGLLEVLGNGAFSVPFFDHPVRGEIRPLVIITSNDTWEMPKAFIRRCVVHKLTLPKGEELVEHLYAIGRAHFDLLDPEVIERAARMIVEDRESVLADDQVKTGQAEFVDLLLALSNLDGGKKEQLETCQSLGRFFFKHDV